MKTPPEELFAESINLAGAVGQVQGFLNGIATGYPELPKHVRDGAVKIAAELDRCWNDLRTKLEA